MAILKKGSKGGDVKKLQTRLNALKCKPVLTVDGDFGKNTEKAVMDFQKKSELKKDGKVGPWTEAALVFGRKLPVMTVANYSNTVKQVVQQRKNYMTNSLTDQKAVEALSKALAVLEAVVQKLKPEMAKVLKANTATWPHAIKAASDLEKKQAGFDALVLKNPDAAAKVVKECVALDKTYKRLVDKIVDTDMGLWDLKEKTRQSARDCGAAIKNFV